MSTCLNGYTFMQRSHDLFKNIDIWTGCDDKLVMAIFGQLAFSQDDKGITRVALLTQSANLRDVKSTERSRKTRR